MNAPPSLCEPTTTPDRGAVCAQIAARLAVCPVCCPRVLPARAAPPQSHSPRTTVEKPRGRGAHRMQRSSSGGRTPARSPVSARGETRAETRRQRENADLAGFALFISIAFVFAFRFISVGFLTSKASTFTSGCRSLPRISHVASRACLVLYRIVTRVCVSPAVIRVYSALTVTRRHSSHVCRRASRAARRRRGAPPHAHSLTSR